MFLHHSVSRVFVQRLASNSCFKDDFHSSIIFPAKNGQIVSSLSCTAAVLHNAAQEDNSGNLSIMSPYPDINSSWRSILSDPFPVFVKYFSMKKCTTKAIRENGTLVHNNPTPQFFLPSADDIYDNMTTLIEVMNAIYRLKYLPQPSCTVLHTIHCLT